jgi:hypothetical protein
MKKHREPSEALANLRRRQCPVKLVEFGAVQKTRFRELSYQCQGKGNWRFLDNSTGAAIGPQHPTRKSLLTDLERYAEVFGCD